MGFSLTSPAPEKCDPTAKNRVWGFFGEAQESRLENHPQTQQPRRENPPTTTKLASGRTYWPSRDPIGEMGGANLYGFVYNTPTSWIDVLGRDPMKLTEDEAELVKDARKRKPDTAAGRALRKEFLDKTKKKEIKGYYTDWVQLVLDKRGDGSIIPGSDGKDYENGCKCGYLSMRKSNGLFRSNGTWDLPKGKNTYPIHKISTDPRKPTELDSSDSQINWEFRVIGFTCKEFSITFEETVQFGDEEALAQQRKNGITPNFNSRSIGSSSKEWVGGIRANDIESRKYNSTVSPLEDAILKDSWIKVTIKGSGEGGKSCCRKTFWIK